MKLQVSHFLISNYITKLQESKQYVIGIKTDAYPCITDVNPCIYIYIYRQSNFQQKEPNYTMGKGEPQNAGKIG